MGAASAGVSSHLAAQFEPIFTQWLGRLCSDRQSKHFFKADGPLHELIWISDFFFFFLFVGFLNVDSGHERLEGRTDPSDADGTQDAETRRECRFPAVQVSDPSLH
jgi:hypothetical protein